MHGILKQVFETGCPLGQDYEQPGQNLLFVQPVFIDVALISSSPFFAAPTLIRSQLWWSRSSGFSTFAQPSPAQHCMSFVAPSWRFKARCSRCSSQGMPKMVAIQPTKLTPKNKICIWLLRATTMIQYVSESWRWCRYKPKQEKCVISLADAGMMVEVNILYDFKYVVYKFISHLNPFDLKDAVIAPLDVTVSTSLTCRKPAAASVVPGADPHFFSEGIGNRDLNRPAPDPISPGQTWRDQRLKR